jgi:hypothetical protein
VANRHMLNGLAEGVEVDLGLSVESFEAVEFERIQLTTWMAVVCEAIPRRLGKSADSAALALDKRIARKVGNLYRSLWAAYEEAGADPAPAWGSRAERLAYARSAPPDGRRAGATVRWAAWFEERRAVLVERRKLAAALALKNGVSRWGVTRVRLIEAELDNIERIAGDAVVRVRRRKERA